MTSFDTDEILRTRRRQKAFCARYGRQSWTQWANLPVTDLIEATRAIATIVEEENALMEER